VATADNPPWSHPGRDVEKYIRTFDPELWRRSDHTGTDASPPPIPPDQPPPYQNWAQRYSIVYESQELVYAIQLPQQSSALQSAADQPPPYMDWQPPSLLPWYAEWRYPPSRLKVTPPQAPPNPPLVGVEWIYTVLRAWEPQFQFPQTLPKFIPTPAVVDNPQPTADVLINILVASWNVPWWTPPQPTKLVQLPPTADNPVPIAHVLLDTLIASWNVPWWRPPQPEKVTPPQEPDQPPRLR